MCVHGLMNTIPSRNLLLFMSFAVGVMAANVYYAQPVLAQLADAVALRPDAAGLIMTFTQFGYGLGVLFAVPLGDLFENKRIILTLVAIAILGQCLLGFVHAIVPYLFASILVGLGASSVQIMVPYTTHLFPRERRGQVIGTLMSGLMLGIMLSRPLSSLLADLVSLHAVFLVSAAVMSLLAIRLWWTIPARQPELSGLRYVDLIWSMKTLLLKTPTLRRRGLYQAMMFGGFCLFWTTVPLRLVQAFAFSQKQVAVFALAGLAGAVAAPLAGTFADRGHGRLASLAAFALGVVGFLVSAFVPAGGALAVTVLAIAANLLDAGVSSHLVLGQRATFMIDPRNQSRLNGLYISITYVGGAVGSALGAWAYLNVGWIATMMIGAAFPLLALLLCLTESLFGYSEGEVAGPSPAI